MKMPFDFRGKTLGNKKRNLDYDELDRMDSYWEDIEEDSYGSEYSEEESAYYEEEQYEDEQYDEEYTEQTVEDYHAEEYVEEAESAEYYEETEYTDNTVYYEAGQYQADQYADGEEESVYYEEEDIAEDEDYQEEAYETEYVEESYGEEFDPDAYVAGILREDEASAQQEEYRDYPEEYYADEEYEEEYSAEYYEEENDYEDKKPILPFSKIMDNMIIFGGVAVVIIALILGGSYLLKSRGDDDIVQQVGTQLDGIDMIGQEGLAALSEAQKELLAMSQGPVETPVPDVTEPPQYEEDDYEIDVNVRLSLTSIEKDLKIKFLNQDTGKLVGNVPFAVEITDEDGDTSFWSDDDMDGIIYKKQLKAGEYFVKVQEFEDEKYKTYGIPSRAVSTQVKSKIKYEKVDVADEVKSESQVDVSKEDTMKNETLEKDYLNDTVVWVESTVTEETYEEVQKNTIPNPLTLVALGRFARLAAEAPGTEVPATAPTEVPVTQAPAEVPVTQAPTEVPATQAPTEAPATQAPTEVPATQAPTEAPATQAPTEVPATQAPTEAPATQAPTEAPATQVPTEAPATQVPTEAPATQAPTASPVPTVTPTVTTSPVPTVTPTATTSPNPSESPQPSASPEPSTTPEPTETPMPMEIVLDKKTAEVYTNETYTLGVEVKNAPKDMVLKAETSNKDIAKVEVKEGKVIVTGVMIGEATITVKCEAKNMESKSVACTVAVKLNPKDDKVTVLKDNQGRELFVYDGTAYRVACHADYFTYSNFYVRKEAKYTGWQTLDGKVKYFDAAGKYIVGSHVIQGVKYQFASDGSLVTGTGTMGIDVSKWNGTIDWNAVKNSGVSYVIIRCGYRGSSKGNLIEDSKFKENIKGATQAGLKVGVYFFSQAVDKSEALEEASMVLESIKGYTISYPVFLDVEPSGGRADSLDKATRTEICKTFCETIKQYGYTPGIYANKNWLENKLDMNVLNNYKIWLAQYASEPTYKGRYDMWQYKDTGKVNGVKGDVDLNMSYLGY